MKQSEQYPFALGYGHPSVQNKDSLSWSETTISSFAVFFMIGAFVCFPQDALEVYLPLFEMRLLLRPKKYICGSYYICLTE